MKKIILPILLTGAIYAQNAENNVTVKLPPKVFKGITAIKMLGKELKKNLKAKLQEDKSGLKAINFCANDASKISAEVAKNFPKGVSVRRVAVKYRNNANKPDKIDAKVLKEFQEKLNNKTLQKKPKVVDVNGTTRVYVPILVTNVCLKCHGQNINPKIKEVIKKHYPNDKAIGFKTGDLRGAMVAEVK